MLAVGKVGCFTSECINERAENFTSGNGFKSTLCICVRRRTDSLSPNRLGVLSCVSSALMIYTRPETLMWFSLLNLQ